MWVFSIHFSDSSMHLLGIISFPIFSAFFISFIFFLAKLVRIFSVQYSSARSHMCEFTNFDTDLTGQTHWKSGVYVNFGFPVLSHYFPPSSVHYQRFFTCYRFEHTTRYEYTKQTLNQSNKDVYIRVCFFQIVVSVNCFHSFFCFHIESNKSAETLNLKINNSIKANSGR